MIGFIRIDYSSRSDFIAGQNHYDVIDQTIQAIRKLKHSDDMIIGGEVFDKEIHMKGNKNIIIAYLRMLQKHE